jgi:large subunit ribosomal protein L35
VREEIPQVRRGSVARHRRRRREDRGGGIGPRGPGDPQDAAVDRHESPSSDPVGDRVAPEAHGGQLRRGDAAVLTRRQLRDAAIARIDQHNPPSDVADAAPGGLLPSGQRNAPGAAVFAPRGGLCWLTGLHGAHSPAETTLLHPPQWIVATTARSRLRAARNRVSYTAALAMPKMKTHSGAKKRFKKTGTGKLQARHAFSSHILEKKSPKRKREFGLDKTVSKADRKVVTQLLGGNGR